MPCATAAGQSQRYGNYVVYYSAISTDLLAPDVARAFGYQRSSHKGLLNIAIRRDAGNGAKKAVTGKVSGSDTVRFDLTVAPTGDTAHKLAFSRDYVVD